MFSLLIYIPLTGSGADSWPLASYLWLMLYGSTQPQCPLAAALNRFVYWTQTSDEAEYIAERCNIFVPYIILMQGTNLHGFKVWYGPARQVKCNTKEDR